MKYIFILLFLPFISFSQGLEGYSTIDDWQDSLQSNNNFDEFEYTSYDDEPVQSNNITKIDKVTNIYDYDFVILNGDTITVDKYIYLKNSGYFIWSRSPYFLGTSNCTPFYHESYQKKSIYRNGKLNLLHIKF
jgi:hypothetical protein